MITSIDNLQQIPSIGVLNVKIECKRVLTTELDFILVYCHRPLRGAAIDQAMRC